MEERKKTRIVVASVLKPVNDTRMREKIARSLQKIHDSDVHVIGFPSDDTDDGVTAHPLPFFRRLSLRRALMPWRVLRLILRLRPALVIITTHELLWIIVICKMIHSLSVVYDVQENYYRNIRYTDAFPRAIRAIVAAYVRAKEWITAPLIDHFFLAESAYENEMNFVQGRCTVIANKALRTPSGEPGTRDPKRLLFSGTIAVTTGIFKAIEIATLLHEIDAAISLTIIGHCPQGATLKEVRDAIADKPFIELIGGDRLVPHDDIVAHIRHAGAGLLAYPKHPSTWGSIPTKLYEYLDARLPVMLPAHPVWVEKTRQFEAGIVFDWDRPDPVAMHATLTSKTFYTREPQDVSWDSEEKKLLRVIESLLARRRLPDQR